jgi:hypothetical protein
MRGPVNPGWRTPPGITALVGATATIAAASIAGIFGLLDDGASGEPGTNTTVVVPTTTAIATTTTAKRIYENSLVPVVRRSQSNIQRTGQELSLEYYHDGRDTIVIDWNGGRVILSGSGDNKRIAPIWTDDILEVKFADLNGAEIGYPVYENYSKDCTTGENSGGAGLDLTNHLTLERMFFTLS